jgi:hypothetical protein
MITGGVEVAFVTITLPLAFVMTRIGAMTRPVATAPVEVDAALGVVVVVAACVRRRLPRGGLAARVGLGVTADVSVGVRTVVFAATVGVAVVAAVVGVAVVFVSVGVVMIAAVVGVAVVPAIVGVVVIAAVVGVAVVAEIVGATVVTVVGPTVAAAVVPAEAITTPPVSPVMTGIGSELMDAFTVACGLAYAEGGMNWPVGCEGCAGFGCGPTGLIVPRKRSR